MKKEVILLILVMLLTPTVSAQAPIDTVWYDTVQWKCDRYHYSLWYDTLPEFFDTVPYTTPNPPFVTRLKLYKYTGHTGDFSLLVLPQHVDRPTRVYGVAVTEPVSRTSTEMSTVLHPWYLEEYVYLFQKAKDSIILLDSVRWDTITPKVMKIALNADTLRFGFEHIFVYEAMFEHPIDIDSLYYVMSTNNSGPVGYLPVSTMVVSNPFIPPSGPQIWCPVPSWFRVKWLNFHTREWSDNRGPQYVNPVFGQFFPIVDYVDLIVTPEDAAMGTAGPVARVSRNMSHEIYAVPKRGYEFSHWQDGDTGMMRYVVVSQDTERYTAYFTAKEPYHVVGLSDDEMMGYVTVDDTVYYWGDTATVEAFVRDVRYKFVRWEDGSTEARRRMLVNGDTSVTAYFAVRPEYTVDVQANYGMLGTVTGGGRYYEGDGAVIEAVARPGGRFVYWDDMVSDNPRTVVVTQDTHFVAVFLQIHDNGVGEVAADGGMFLLVPNPASSEVRCVTGGEGFAGGTLSVTDAAGRTVLRKELARQTQSYTFRVSDYPAGTYYVTLTTPTGTSTRKLVVE